jgi:hypothetical protein
VILIDNEGNYPRHVGDLRLAHPDYKDGDPLPEGWLEVAANDPDNVPEGHVSYELAPQEIDGVWYRVWASRPPTEEELAEREHVANRPWLGE